jgi:serine/threonine protein kinase/WD40 repeat protein
MEGRPNPERDLRLVLEAFERGLVDRSQLERAVRQWGRRGRRSMLEILRDFGTADEMELSRLAAQVASQSGPRSDAVATVTFAESLAPDGAGGERAAVTAGGAGDLPRFQVLRSHGRGGLGEVYLAHDRELNRSVALKELRAGLAHDPASQARFLFEAEVTGQLEHPGIVPVYSLGRYADGRPYYAMHLVQGETLREAIERYHRHAPGAQGRDEGRNLEFRRLLRSVIDACNAVAYAHSRGVVHRDLKPENIMLGRFGETLVLDWGVAKKQDGARDEAGLTSVEERPGADTSMTRPGSVLGTPRYMSPEQASGELDRVGPASDLYGLGAVLYCVLVGHDAFMDGGRTSVLSRVRRGIFPSPRRLRRSIDPALEAICLKAMSHDPSARHESALELARELEAWLADVRYRGEQELALNELKGTLARLCVERAASCFGREMRGEGMLWLARGLENAPAEPPDLSRVIRTSLWCWHAGMKLLERSVRHDGEVSAIALCPEGRRLATACEDGATLLWDLSTGLRLSQPLKHDGPVRSMALSADGLRLATLEEDGLIRSWDAVNGDSIGAPILAGREARIVRVSPDGSIVASTVGAGGPLVSQVETGKILCTARAGGGAVRSIALGREGRRLAVMYEDGAVYVLEEARGWQHESPLIRAENAQLLDVDGLGEWLLIGNQMGEVRLWNVEGRSCSISLSLGSAIQNAAFQPGGEAFATLCADGTARLWNRATGRPIGEPLQHRSRVDCLAFHPDGTQVATGGEDGAIRLWCAVTGLGVGPPLTHGGTVRTIVFSGDGRRFATLGSDRVVRCWNSPNEVEGDAERISCWVRVSTELDFDAGDAIRRMDSGTSLELRRRLIDLGGAPIR